MTSLRVSMTIKILMKEGSACAKRTFSAASRDSYVRPQNLNYVPISRIAIEDGIKSGQGETGAILDSRKVIV